MRFSKILGVFFAILFFAACYHKTPKEIFHNKLKRNLIFTKKIRKNGIIFIATYLKNHCYNKNYELFFIRIAPKKTSFSIFLNGKPPIETEKLSINSPFSQSMPVARRWFDLYLIKFPKSRKKELLLISNKKKVKLTF